MVYGGTTAPLPAGTYQVTVNAVDINQTRDSNPPRFYAQLQCEILGPDSVEFGGKTISCAGREFKMMQSLDPTKPNGMSKVREFAERLKIADTLFPADGFNPEEFVKFLRGKVFDVVLQTAEYKPRASVTEAERAAGKKTGDVLKDSEGKEISMGHEVVLFKGLTQFVRLSNLQAGAADVPY